MSTISFEFSSISFEYVSSNQKSCCLTLYTLYSAVVSMLCVCARHVLWVSAHLSSQNHSCCLNFSVLIKECMPTCCRAMMSVHRMIKTKRNEPNHSLLQFILTMA